MAAISIRKLFKRYGHGAKAVQVIHGVDAEVKDGEFVVIVGPSGCGKSTLLRMVAGLEEVSDGEIAIGARVVNDVEPADRDIAMVFQNYALYPHLTVGWQSSAFGLKVSARSNQGRNRSTCGRSGRQDRLGSPVSCWPAGRRELSGGQRQRVAHGSRASCEESGRIPVRRAAKQSGRASCARRCALRLKQAASANSRRHCRIYVTHDQVEAMTLAQRIIVMIGGRIEQMGTPEEVYGRPASTFVASFIGSPAMNLLPGRQHGGQFHIDGAALDVPPGVEGDLTLGLRPEHVQLADRGWPLRVEMIEMLGAERLIYGKLGAGTPFTLRLDATLAPPQPGDWLHLAFSPEYLHRFDAKTGLRL